MCLIGHIQLVTLRPEFQKDALITCGAYRTRVLNAASRINVIIGYSWLRELRSLVLSTCLSGHVTLVWASSRYARSLMNFPFRYKRLTGTV